MIGLAVRGLSVSFGGVRALRDVTFAVEPGETLSIVGPNGAGKTTVFNLVSRLFDADAGTIQVGGRDITRLARHEIAALGIARTFQNLELFDHASVLDNLLLARHAHRQSSVAAQILRLPSAMRAEIDHRGRAEQVIERFELERFRNAIVANLPYGARKLVEFARALCLEPKLLLLDEPAAGLNPEERFELAFRIADVRADLNTTIVLVEHDMGLVGEVSDRVLVLNDGQVLAEGTPDAIRRDPGVIAAYLGAPA
jgi:branched-chain amino acid transport system ATP-binding protein